ncbi:MAG: TIGR02281 family clan AA aspartic protease [Candidatus Omnitrophica bacterium]|nr:TIGR02281 family clan AA aspartic protease [Candidatus Omnitrophota bacterium]
MAPGQGYTLALGKDQVIMAKKFTVILMVLAWFLCIASYCRADTIYLKNGREIKGIIKEETEKTLELDIDIGTVKFHKVEIDSIERSSAAESRELKARWESKKQALAEERKMRAEEARLKAQLPIKDLEAARQAGHIVVPAMLNRKVAVSLLVDTGASIIVLSKAAGDKLDIKPDAAAPIVKLRVADGREVGARYVGLESVIVDSQEEKNVEAAILMDDNASIVFDGVLGMSFLSRLNFRFDNKNNKLILERIK